MNNEEAVTYGNELIQCSTGSLREFAELATRALRTPPATGAAAMREACAAECDAIKHDFKIEADDAQRKGLFSQENDYAMRFYGARACAAAIRALPAPEAPEAVRKLHEYQKKCGVEYASRSLPDDHPDKIMRDMWDFLRKEYGL